MRGLKRAKGFSALSNSGTEVLRLTTENSSADAKALANVLTKDVTSIQRVLTSANSALKGPQPVTTVSQAVVRLGQARVRLCITNALMEAQFAQGSNKLKDVLLSSFFSGALAKEISTEFRYPDRGDIFTAASFHGRGRMLVIHCLPDEFDELEELIAQVTSSLGAQHEILARPYSDVGAAVGAHWQLPQSLIDAMKLLSRGAQVVKLTNAEKLRAVLAAFSNEVVTAVQSSDADVRAQWAALIERITPAHELDLET
jgi:HD-like signal output (HDOD) protein